MRAENGLEKNGNESEDCVVEHSKEQRLGSRQNDAPDTTVMFGGFATVVLYILRRDEGSGIASLVP